MTLYKQYKGLCHDVGNMALYILNVVCVLLTHFTPVKSLAPSAAVPSYRALAPSAYCVTGCSRRTKGGGGMVDQGPGSSAPSPLLTSPHRERKVKG